MAIFDTLACEKAIGYTFKDKMLLRRCFTHASYAFEHGGQDNEVLEFFGDSIIEYLVTEYLYKNCLGDEGRLTFLRAKIVSKDPLLRASKQLGLDKLILLGNGQSKNVKADDKLFSSVYEAIVAGIYLDGGLAKARKFIKNTIIKNYEKDVKSAREASDNNSIKSKFQEYVQKKHLGSIRYELLGKSGPEHLPEFRVGVLLNNAILAEGTGKSKRGAEAVAAKTALAKLIKQVGK